jgi:hypothetical protein
MRIALIPMDSRPVNTLFPERLAQVAGVTLVQPPRDAMGSLHRGADGVALARWLEIAVSGSNGNDGCDVAVFSWDALIHGGLIQSRRWDGDPQLEPVATTLRAIDWRRVAGYAFITVPRLGISILSSGNWVQHELVREYFIQCGRAPAEPKALERVHQLEEQLGKSVVEGLWTWRQRNLGLVKDIVELSQRLGLRRLHVAVEDNAPTGPHIDEVAELRRMAAKTGSDAEATCYSFFDGADEAGCLLLANAIAERRSLEPLPVQLTVHPTAPGADQYTGLYESRTLGDGLTFLADVLSMSYSYDEQQYHWLVAHGVQPQPDVFAQRPAEVFDNPYLLPRRLLGSGSLFVSDLCACNGANPRLAEHLAGQGTMKLRGFVGFNTNFNTLALTAAWLRLAQGSDPATTRRFLLERLADDLAYQSIARPAVIEYLQGQELDPLDFSEANTVQVDECCQLVSRCWRDWCEGRGAGVLSAAGISPGQALAVEFSFPWSRAFEILARAPSP